jgi:PRTRC genetic system protein B
MSTSLIQSYKPEHQLVIYKSQSGAYVEHFEILEVDGKKVLSEGKPLAKSTLKKMLDLVIGSSKGTYATLSKLMPENILYYDPRPGKVKMIWYNPAQERTLIGINKKPVKAKLPAFLYMLHEDDLHVYVMKTGAKRPDLKTQLFHAPLPNVYEDAHICMGSVKKPKNATEISDLVKGWEFVFWGSHFSDAVWDKETEKKLKDCIKSKKQFNPKLLTPHKQAIAHLIK